MSRLLARLGFLLTATAAILTSGGAVAAAHVNVHADETVPGAVTEIAFRIPNESDTASTVAVSLRLPADTPIAEVAVLPLQGWTYTVTRTTPPTPVAADHGREVSEVVSEITWQATEAGIKPGEYQVFRITAGPLPKVDQLVFKAVQTYSDGQILRWIDVPIPGEPEPEHPAPVLALNTTAASGHGHDEVAAVTPAASSRSTTPTSAWWATTTLALAALIAALGSLVVSIRTSRHRGGEDPPAV